MLYRLYNFIIASDNFLLGMPVNGKSEADIQVKYLSPSKLSISPSSWFMRWNIPGVGEWLSLAKLEGGYLLRFKELSDFYVDNYGKEVVCIPKPEVPQESIRHLLLDQVIPLIINLKGGEALHVSAVLMPQGIVAFAGLTGSGKSTLAGSFLLLGYPFFSDDCLPLIEQYQGIYGIPAYPGLRLWDDAMRYLFKDNGPYESVAHYTDKRRVNLGGKQEVYCKEPQLLRWLYVISNPSKVEGKTDITIDRLSPRESFMELVQCAFRLDITDRKMLERQFHFLEKVVSNVSIRRLIYPRDFNLLPSVREAILKDLQDLDN